jgi:MerR family transcriptional regulator/heat shock protein HspR
MHMRERITALAPYDGMSPEKVMKGLLGGGPRGE